MKTFAIAIFAISLISPNNVKSRVADHSVAVQGNDANERSREILVSFNKTKHEVREVYGLRREKYKQIHSEAAVRASLADYAGRYKVPDLGYMIVIVRDASGMVVTGSDSQDNAQGRRFHLENVQLDQALLTGTKIYDNGAQAPFEGLFINMTDYEGTSPTEVTHRATTFGLGVVGVSIKAGDVTSYKIFYHFEP
ncbi:MAG: hypothetical protein JO356_15375 [Acidobacteria bacterium]|nr:hypothetical protein [Acidobacteriota bacterium]